MKKGQLKYTEFGMQAKIAMIKQGLTNRELAHRLDYSESTLCDVLKGRNRCERRLREIEIELNMDGDALTG